MKITYVAHACLHVELGGIQILMDPWLDGPCWGGNIWPYPPSKKKPEDFSGIDYFYFSHAHDDHLHPKTLSRFHPNEKKSKTFIPNFGLSYFENAVRANGFNNIQKLNHNEIIEIAPGVKLEMLINDLGAHDSSILLHADGVTVMFQTDNILSIDEAKRIGSKYQINAVFTITSLTGIFPGFFNFPIDTMMRLSKEKRMRSFYYSLDIIKALGAKIVVPYASDLCYLGDLYFANDLHASDKRDFALMITNQGLDTKPILMGPDDVLEISADHVFSILGDHDFGGDKLGAYAVSMRDQVAEVAIEEHQYAAIPYQKDIALLRSIMDRQSNIWGDENFRVLWEVIGPDGSKDTFFHLLPGITQDSSDQLRYDLKIEIPSYRLQRLVRGDYKMGFLTLQNGSIRCNRHSENLTGTEKKYWAWAMANIRFFKSPNILK